MQWFIYIDQELIGPFTKETLKEYLTQHNLPDSTLIKSSKMTNPMKFSSIFSSTKSELAEIPKLPSLPSDTFEKTVKEIKTKSETEKTSNAVGVGQVLEENKLAKEKENKQNKEDREKKKDEKSKKISKKKIDNIKKENLISGELSKTKERQVTSDNTSSQIISDIESLDISSKKPYKLIFSFVVLFALLLSSYLYLKQYSPRFIRPTSMSLKTYKKASKIHSSNYLKAKLFLSKDKKTLWFVTSNFVTGKLRLSLDSIKSRVLTKDKVLMTSDSTLKNGVAVFDKLIFESNDQIIEGEYMMSIENISKLSKPLMYSLKKTELNINYRQKILLSNFSSEIFETKLKEYLKKINKNNNEFTRELVQKYLTLRSMVEQIKAKFLETFSNTDLSWKNRSKLFEEIYKKQFGPFFTTFVISNEKEYDRINKKEFPSKLEIISDYTRLSRLAKEVGLSSVNIMIQYEKFDFSESDVDKVLKFKKSVVDSFDRVIKIYNDKIISLTGDEFETK